MQIEEAVILPTARGNSSELHSGVAYLFGIKRDVTVFQIKKDNTI